eukprot:1242505-Prymnesium_polylepis.1
MCAAGSAASSASEVLSPPPLVPPAAQRAREGVRGRGLKRGCSTPKGWGGASSSWVGKAVRRARDPRAWANRRNMGAAHSS